LTGSREQPFTGWFLTPNGWLPGQDSKPNTKISYCGLKYHI
jgi:hypothetical protein